MIAQDLLNNVPVWPDTETRLNKHFYAYKGQRVLVTGACGSVGYELTKFLHSAGAIVTAVDNNELEIVKRLKSDPGINWQLSDFETCELLPETDAVFHCAAFKHVDLSAKFEKAFMMNNYQKVERFTERVRTTCPLSTRFVLLSTDKAAGKTILGQSKRLAEACVNSRRGNKYVALRLVNIAYSRGSVLENWKKDKDPWVCPGHVERYWMTMRDALAAILDIASYARGTYTVHDVPLYNMGDLATVFEQMTAKKIQRRPELRVGEVDREALVGPDEVMTVLNPYYAKVEYAGLNKITA